MWNDWYEQSDRSIHDQLDADNNKTYSYAVVDLYPTDFNYTSVFLVN